MHTQMIDAPLVTTPWEARAKRWKTRAVEEYERSLPDRLARLRTDFAARLLGSTGRSLSLENVYVEADGRFAVAGVDGETFRLNRQGGLVLVRACAYCGTGSFESPEITDRVNLGYALSAWHPLHEDCKDYDASETLADW
jgi:hypothetical protein